jgi:putative polyketide hydroxylase
LIDQVGFVGISIADRVEVNRVKASTHDLFGAGFTLLTGPDGEAWRCAAADAAQRLGVPIASYTIGASDLSDRNKTLCGLYGIGHYGAVLVRPDGYVAWRSANGPTDSAALLSATQQILNVVTERTITEH